MQVEIGHFWDLHFFLSYLLRNHVFQLMIGSEIQLSVRKPDIFITDRFLQAQKSYSHQNLRNESWDRLLLKSAKIFVMPPQEPCFPAQDWIRNLAFTHDFKHQKIRISNFRPKELSGTNNRFPSLLYHLRFIFDEIRDQKYEFGPIFGSEMLISSFKNFAL